MTLQYPWKGSIRSRMQGDEAWMSWIFASERHTGGVQVAGFIAVPHESIRFSSNAQIARMHYSVAQIFSGFDWNPLSWISWSCSLHTVQSNNLELRPPVKSRDIVLLSRHHELPKQIWESFLFMMNVKWQTSSLLWLICSHVVDSRLFVGETTGCFARGSGGWFLVLEIKTIGVAK